MAAFFIWSKSLPSDSQILSIVDREVRAFIKLVQDAGWIHVRTRGSHRQFKHATKGGLVTVSGQPGVDVPPGTLDSILKQAGLKE